VSGGLVAVGGATAAVPCITPFWRLLARSCRHLCLSRWLVLTPPPRKTCTTHLARAQPPLATATCPCLGRIDAERASRHSSEKWSVSFKETQPDKKHHHTTPHHTTTPAVYCAHEYTLANAKFAVSVEPSNARLQERLVDVQDKRQRGQPTVPTQMGLEKATNPFLRYASPEIRKVGLLHAAMHLSQHLSYELACPSAVCGNCQAAGCCRWCRCLLQPSCNTWLSVM
jgi:hypothetical protein